MTRQRTQRIPRIIHQLWIDEKIPRRWLKASESVKKYHEGWAYHLWTDASMDAHVRIMHPDFYPIFVGMNRHMMRVDVFRYILMNDFGGLYCDLDYEFLRPFDYGDAELVLAMECDKNLGDNLNGVANFICASTPGHELWLDLIEDLRVNPPFARTALDIGVATGPAFLSRVFFANRDSYIGVRVAAKPLFCPLRVHGRYERKFYLNSGVTYGFHHGWGSWKERLTFDYFRGKLRKCGRWLGRARWSRAD